ncbi:hypothetical protein AB0J86_30915 [Micromonospora sp. NPDC049559]|uniref:hypothetical protein n=1 Tax=Micromonospora sp. NPDC049559 TaxID=3155923 RepID=UPI0034123B0B
MGLWFPKRLPGEERTRPRPKPIPKPPDPKPEEKPKPETASYVVVLLRETAWVLGGLCLLMVLPWP